MSEPLDTKGTLDQVLQFAAEEPRLTRAVTVFTSFFALLAAFSGLMGSRCTTRGIVAKNDAILAQNAVVDEWIYFQAKNIRSDIGELALALVKNPEAQKKNKDRLKSFGERKEQISSDAKAFQAERDNLNRRSAAYLDVSRYFASALILLQVALILTPLTLLVRKRQLLNVGSVIGLLGIGYLFVAIVQFFRVT
jgi:hypothetical protein